MRRRVPLALALLALVVAAAAVAIALTRSSGYVAPAAAANEEATVQNATLSPGRIVLALRNPTGEPLRVAQIAVNDGYVDFSGARVAPGATGRVTIAYPWIEGESYEFELLTTDGGAIEYELEDAGAD